MSKIVGVAAGAAPIDPAAEKAETLAWLDDRYCTDDLWARKTALKAMLAEPRLPHSPTNAMLYAMGSAAYGEHAPGPMGDAYRALYAHLTKPATKTVEVWRVDWASEDSDPRSMVFATQHHADEWAKYLRKEFRKCIHVTGPHKQEVPA